MFGPIAQSIIGWGWTELIFRGAILGCLFGAIHRWYVKRSYDFWATLIYLWLTVWSYYTIRSSSFGFVYGILQIVIPTILLVFFLRRLLQVLPKLAIPRSASPAKRSQIQ